eukprot:UN08014
MLIFPSQLPLTLFYNAKADFGATAIFKYFLTVSRFHESNSKIMNDLLRSNRFRLGYYHSTTFSYDSIEPSYVNVAKRLGLLHYPVMVYYQDDEIPPLDSTGQSMQYRVDVHSTVDDYNPDN